MIACSFSFFCAWDQKEEHSITGKAATHLLRKHVASSASLTVVSDQLNPFLSDGPPPSSLTRLTQSFEKLKSGLEALSSLPLQIVAIHKMGDTLLGTSSTFPKESAAVRGVGGGGGGEPAVRKGKKDNSPGRVSLFVTPHEVAIEFQFSGKWPQREVVAGGGPEEEDTYEDEIMAIKSSFLVLMGRELREMYDYQSIAQDDCLDVLLDGYVFRLRIHYRQQRVAAVPTELLPAPLRRNDADDGERARLMHAKLIEAMTRREQNFAAICRLCKRWMSSQMFSMCMAAENVELMVVHCFTNARRYRSNSADSTITRFFLVLNALVRACRSLCLTDPHTNHLHTPLVRSWRRTARGRRRGARRRRCRAGGA